MEAGRVKEQMFDSKMTTFTHEISILKFQIFQQHYFVDPDRVNNGPQAVPERLESWSTEVHLATFIMMIVVWLMYDSDSISDPIHRDPSEYLDPSAHEGWGEHWTITYPYYCCKNFVMTALMPAKSLASACSMKLT